MHPLQVLYEDNHIIIVLKEPNVLVQGDATGDDTLLAQVKSYVKEKYNKPGEAYIGLVHRLDRPVGGVMCFARTGKAAARLSEQLRSHEMRREDVAVVGGMTEDDFTLKHYLKQDAAANMVTVLPDYLKAQGKEAILHGHTIERREGRSLVAIRLETGRPHQIRVQMKASGHAILGDNRYGDGKPGEHIALWGMRLTLKHPTTGKQMVFIAPAPREGFFLPFATSLETAENLWPTIRER